MTSTSTWMSALESFVDPNTSSKERASPSAFGERCVLIGAAREAFRSGDVVRLQTCLQGLIKRAQTISKLYGDEFAEQGRGILLALCHTILAASQSGNDLAWKHVSTAVNHWNRAWPGVPTGAVTARADGADSLLDQFFQQAPAQGTLGFWVVWDLLDQFKSDRPGRRVPPTTSAALPVLLYDERLSAGAVALLTVELIQGQGTGFHPDPARMGLTAFGLGESRELNILRSMQHAWRCSQVAERGYRARWKITTFRGKNGQDQDDQQLFTAPTLEGRSLEAATCCALWAAAGGIPGEHNHVAEPQQLDPSGTVTATIELPDNQPLPAKPAELRLGEIAGWVPKVNAAKARKLDLVLHCDKQSGVTKDLEMLDGNKVISLTPCRTISEAYHWLIGMQAVEEAYRQEVSLSWPGSWRLVIGEDGRGQTT